MQAIWILSVFLCVGASQVTETCTSGACGEESSFLQHLGAGKASQRRAGGEFNVSALIAAFNSESGVQVRVADPMERVTDGPTSTTVWQRMVPPSLFNLDEIKLLEEQMGIILGPGAVRDLCSYPVNADTKDRKASGGQEDPCGRMPCFLVQVPETDPSCNNTHHVLNYTGLCPEIFASEPDKFANSFFDTMINTTMCSFLSVNAMLAAQTAMWKLAAEKKAVALKSSILVGFNEVVIDRHDATAVVGAFWAHPGPFRDEPSKSGKLCRWLRDHDASDLDVPLFEVALVVPSINANIDVNIGPTLQWQQGNVSAGGYDATKMFRQIDVTKMKVECILEG